MMNADTEDRVDRYRRGELTPAEARQLAQESLESPELFDELACSALAKAAVAPPPAATRRRSRFLLPGSIAAAIAAFLALYWFRAVPSKPARPPMQPSLASSAAPGQPILLASDLEPQPGQDASPVFRGVETAARAPRPEGAILAIEDGEATVDLGSLDGIAKGTALEVMRGPAPSARVIVTTVFRERARGRIEGGGASLRQRVRVPAAVYANALAALAAIEYRGGAHPAAEAHYQAAADALSAAPETAANQLPSVLNNLAVLRILRGDHAAAEANLTTALAKSPASDIVHARAANNLGVLAELRGDRQRAASLYQDAIRSPAGEQSIIGKNLARVKPSP